MPPWYPQFVAPIRPPMKKHLSYPTYVKGTNPDAHIHVFKKAIKDNEEIINEYIINTFDFILCDNIFKWGENFLQDHPDCIFVEFEQVFYKHYKMGQNDEQIYLKL
jgi:hypothetical protein